VGVGEGGVQQVNTFGPSFFEVKKCVSGEIEIKSVCAFFALEDGPDMNFCLKGYNDTDCEGTDLVVDHQWDIACTSSWSCDSLSMFTHHKFFRILRRDSAISIISRLPSSLPKW
jgi:hypothetical protein